MKKARNIYKKLLKKSKYRHSVLKELVKTEQQYVKYLKIIKDDIKQPLLSILSKDEIDTLFKNIDSIYFLNKGFYD